MLKRILIICAIGMSAPLIHAQNAAVTAPAAAAPAPAAAPAGDGKTMTPVERSDATPQGKLKNPYADTDATVVAAGQQLYLNNGCNGCHGGTGGGGMCPPLTNDVWVYGGDDDTLFRLVAYGTQILQSKGYSRRAQESVVGPMPQMGLIVKTDDDLWKILAFVRSNYHGAPECKFGCPPQ